MPSLLLFGHFGHTWLIEIGIEIIKIVVHFYLASLITFLFLLTRFDRIENIRYDSEQNTIEEANSGRIIAPKVLKKVKLLPTIAEYKKLYAPLMPKAMVASAKKAG